jgi:hypothetical protein
LPHDTVRLGEREEASVTSRSHFGLFFVTIDRALNALDC